MAKKNVTSRREGALERFKTQLQSGVKPVKVDGKTTNQTVALSDGDKQRIEKQIATLDERIKKSVV